MLTALGGSKNPYTMKTKLIIFLLMAMMLSTVSVANHDLRQHDNKEVRKYHRKNKKQFKCSLCPPRGLKKLVPKRWR